MNLERWQKWAALIVVTGGAVGVMADYGVRPIIPFELTRVETKVDKVLEISEVFQKSIQTLDRINENQSKIQKRLEELEEKEKDRELKDKDKRIKDLEERLRRKESRPR